MDELSVKQCVACRADAPLATAEEREGFMAQLPDWKIIHEEGMDRLTRTFTFKNFVEALAFTNRIGEIAEQEDHHPALLTEWGRVKVTWWTHKIKGLHVNDFVMAARTNGMV